MIQTILFAADLGVYTPYLLHHVNSLASQHHARIIVIHAIEPAGHLGDAVVETYLSCESRAELKQEGIARIAEGIKSRIVDALEDEFIDGQSGLSAVRDVRVITGRPVDVILDQAQDCAADMIILGSHGQHTRCANVLGSVAAKVLQLSRVPVYLVPLLRGFPQQAQVC